MKILFDTHTFLWFMNGDKNISTEALGEILDKNNSVFISAASYWEICIKISIGKLRLTDNWQRIIKDQLYNNRIMWLDIKKEHLEEIINLPWHHRDPFDRILIAQAKIEECVLCTADPVISTYGIKTI